MWIITESKIINLDNFDELCLDQGQTYIRNAENPYRRISNHDVLEQVATAIRENKTFVEVR